MIEYVLVAYTIALLGTVYLFGDFGSNSRDPNTSYPNAQSEYSSPLEPVRENNELLESFVI